MIQQSSKRRQEKAPATMAQVSDWTRQTIVFVDDSHTIMRAAMLACDDVYQLVFVAMGGIVERVVEMWRPDLVVIVGELADADGYDLCRSFRTMESVSDVPVVLLWGESAPYDEELGREVGVTHNLRKPFETEHLHETFRALLEGREPPPPEGPPWPETRGVDAPAEVEDPVDDEEGTVDFQDLVDAHAEVLEEIISSYFQGMDTSTTARGELILSEDRPRRRIFMFESDQALVKALEGHLEAYHIQLESTDDGNEGLARVAQNPPDLILVTIELPGTNGFALCNDLKKSPSHERIPVIVLSSEVSEETFERHRKLKTHADDYLRKPFEITELMQKVSKLLERRRSSVPPPPDGDMQPGDSSALDWISMDEGSPIPHLNDDEASSEEDWAYEFELPINEQWLVVLWSGDPSVRGKRFNITNMGDLPSDLSEGLWLENLVSVGRSSLNKVVIDDPRVSGWHFRIQRKEEAIVLTDLRSEHGTWVNDRRVVRAELQGGEVIRAGGTVIKFINDQYLSASFEEILREFSEREWPSGLINKHVILERLEEATVATTKAGDPLSIMAIFIDDFRQLSNELGVLDHAWILEEFALLLRAKFGDREIGRNVEGGFLVILPETRGEDAERMADELRRAVERREIKIRRRRVKLGVSIGVVEWSAGLSIRETILHANALVYKAQQSGGNAVELECLNSNSQDDPSCRAVPDAEWVLRKVLATDHLRPMVAFELEDERKVIERHGPDGWTVWLDKLVQEVLSATRPGDLVGTWKDRYVVAALDSGKGAERVCERVLSFWDRFRGGGERGLSGSITIRSAALSAREVGEYGSATLKQLAETLLVAPQDVVADWRESAPFPLAVAAATGKHSLVESTSSVAWSMEVVMRFIAAVLLSGLRLRDSAKSRRGLRAILNTTTSSLALASDATPVLELARLARDEDDYLLRPLAKLIVSRAGRRMIKRSTDVNRAARSAKNKDASAMVDAAETFVQKVSQRLECAMFSVAEIVDFSDKGEIIYGLRRHQGPSEVFPVEQAALSHQLRRDWCSVTLGGEIRPLSLAPLFAAIECDHCGRVEVFVGDRLKPATDGAGLVMQGVVSGHEQRLLSTP